jgi:Sodium:solute symporter family
VRRPRTPRQELAEGTRTETSISVLVGWAFALAASTFCPLFLLGIWWRGLTARGAIAGMAAGGLVASSGIVTTLVAEPSPTTLGALLAQPAVLSVPVAFATRILVSLTDRERPAATEETMLALHGPEGLGLEALRAELNGYQATSTGTSWARASRAGSRRFRVRAPPPRWPRPPARARRSSPEVLRRGSRDR